MKKQTSSRSVLLLMEIILAILFFSVVSAVCLQLFVRSHEMGKDTEELDMAVRQAVSVAEVISQSGQPMEQLREIYADADMGGEGGLIYFDREFQMCPQETAWYRLEISPAPMDERTVSYTVAFYSEEKTEAIYSLEVVAYRQRTP